MASTKASGSIIEICRYPVKGLSPDRLDEVILEPGDTLPYDRAYAVENGGRDFDFDNPRHLPKSKFLMLAKHERLASIETSFDEATGLLTVLRDNKQVARGNLRERIGRQMLEQFFAAFMKGDLNGAPRIVGAEGISLSDTSVKCVSIINHETVKDIERVSGQSINPLRFRGNLLIEGVEPWAELDWVNRDIRIGNEVVLYGIERIMRCAATNVDPATALRDMTIPQTLNDAFGHTDCGIYAEISFGGKIKKGDKIEV